MKVVIEDYFGNDLCSFECTELKNPKNCNVADIDIDEDGFEYMRVQYFGVEIPDRLEYRDDIYDDVNWVMAKKIEESKEKEK